MIVLISAIACLLCFLILFVKIVREINESEIIIKAIIAIFILTVFYIFSGFLPYIALAPLLLVLIAEIKLKLPFHKILFSLIKVSVYSVGVLVPFFAVTVFLKCWHGRFDYSINHYITYSKFPSELIGLFGMIFAATKGIPCIIELIKQLRTIQNLPTSAIGSAASGLNEFKGIIRPVNEMPFNDKKDCFPFYLEDGTGKLLVDPENVKNYPGFWDIVFNSNISGIHRGGKNKYFTPGTEAYLLGNLRKDGIAEDMVIKPKAEKHKRSFIEWVVSSDPKNVDDPVFWLSTAKEESIIRHIRYSIFLNILLLLLWLFISFALQTTVISNGNGKLSWSYDLFKVKDLLPQSMLDKIYSKPPSLNVPENNYRTWTSERAGTPPIIRLDFNDNIKNLGTLKVTPVERYGIIKYQPGIEGKAGYFDGTYYLDLFSETPVDFGGSFTIEFWFKPDRAKAWDDTLTRYILLSNFTPDFLSASLAFQGPVNKKIVSLVTGNLKHGTAQEIKEWYKVTDNLYEMRWYHFFVSYDRNRDKLAYYLDGKALWLSEGGQPAFKIPERIENLSIGQTYSYSSKRDNFRGWVDEFYFYDYARPVE